MKPLFHLNKYLLKYKTHLLLGIVFVTISVIYRVFQARFVGDSFDTIETLLSNTSTELELSNIKAALIKYGLIPEFIGRMPIIATLNDLDQKSLIKILTEPKNSLIKQYQKLFEFENVPLEFKDEAMVEIAKKAIHKKTGARGLRSILENILLKTMFKLPELENVHKVTVDKSSVKGESEPIVTYGKKQSTSVAYKLISFLIF